jgi:hypothetical protein
MNNMNETQQKQLAIYLAVKAVCDDQRPVWRFSPDFVDNYTDFAIELTNIYVMAQNRLVDNTGISQHKLQTRVVMANAGLVIGSALRAYAIKTTDYHFAEKLDCLLSDLACGRDMDAAENGQKIHDAAHDNLASLAAYGLTAAKLCDLQAAIDAFTPLLSKPLNAKTPVRTLQQRRQAAFNAADLALEKLDKIISEFEAAHAAFVNNYRSARQLRATSGTSMTMPAMGTPRPAAF